MGLFRDYVRPATIKQAIDYLSEFSGSAAIIAGGTDLLLDIRQGRHEPVDKVIDVSGITEMQELSRRRMIIFILGLELHINRSYPIL